MLGGAMRQVGVIAAAGLYALEHNRKRVVDDHTNAQLLADRLACLDGVEVHARNTNMVFATLPVDDARTFEAQMQTQGVMLSLHGQSTRLVTHIDIDKADIDTAVAILEATLA